MACCGTRPGPTPGRGHARGRRGATPGHEAREAHGRKTAECPMQWPHKKHLLEICVNFSGTECTTLYLPYHRNLLNGYKNTWRVDDGGMGNVR